MRIFGSDGALFQTITTKSSRTKVSFTLETWLQLSGLKTGLLSENKAARELCDANTGVAPPYAITGPQLYHTWRVVNTMRMSLVSWMFNAAGYRFSPKRSLGVYISQLSLSVLAAGYDIVVVRSDDVPAVVGGSDGLGVQQ